MTAKEKRALLLLAAALLLGIGLQAARRSRLERSAAGMPVAIAGEAEELDPAGLQVNVNTATELELDALPGIGPVTSARIVAWREKHGRFSSVEQLTRVPGIGPKKLEAIRELVTVRVQGGEQGREGGGR